MADKKEPAKTLKYPSYTIMSQSVMHDGKQVLIMTPEQWYTYCYNYNKLNNIPQPPQLERDLKFFADDAVRRRKF